MVDAYAKNQCLRSNGSNRRVPTDKRTDGRYQTYYRPCYAVDKNHEIGLVDPGILVCAYSLKKKKEISKANHIARRAILSAGLTEVSRDDVR